MRRLRRTSTEPRLELTPLIDVVFLLLTFFVFSLVLMERVNLLRIDLPVLGAGDRSGSPETITVLLDADGRLYLNAEPVEADRLPDRIRELREGRDDIPLFIAGDEGGRTGDLLRLLDRLAAEGITEFSFIGRPSEIRPEATNPGESSGSDPARPDAQEQPGPGQG